MKFLNWDDSILVFKYNWDLRYEFFNFKHKFDLNSFFYIYFRIKED